MAVSKGNTSIEKVRVVDENGYFIENRKWFGQYDKSLANLVGYVHLGTHVDGAPIVREKTPIETVEELKFFGESIDFKGKKVLNPNLDVWT
jgi:hypothetical protein